MEISIDAIIGTYLENKTAFQGLRLEGKKGKYGFVVLGFHELPYDEQVEVVAEAIKYGAADYIKEHTPKPEPACEYSDAIQDPKFTI